LIPGRSSLWLAGALIAFACAAALLPWMVSVWLLASALIAVFMIIDGIALLLTKKPQVKRILPERFALNAEQNVELVFHNENRRTLAVEVFDGIPDWSVAEDFPWMGKLPANAEFHLRYPLRFVERGPASIQAAFLIMGSPMGLWQRRIRVAGESETKVYPDYSPVIQMALLATQSSRDQMGIRFQRRSGASRKFLQLREYQHGDALNIVDWKSTSRHRKLISREFEEQRHQSIIFLLDTGRRMRAIDGNLPQFDHCLNAVLFVSYLALNQGDQVAIMSFGGERRWLPPVQGPQSMPQVLNHLYDAFTSPVPSDYHEAAEQLMLRQKRRAMVVLMTNLRGDNPKELLGPMTLLRQRHHVILATLREQEVEAMVRSEAHTLEDGLSVGAARLYMDERRMIAAELETLGIGVIDTTAADFPVALANGYLADRARGVMG